MRESWKHDDSMNCWCSSARWLPARRAPRSGWGGLLGALALDRGALAKEDKDESEKAEAKPEQPEQGAGEIPSRRAAVSRSLSPARPVCRAPNDTGNCPACRGEVRWCG